MVLVSACQGVPGPQVRFGRRKVTDVVRAITRVLANAGAPRLKEWFEGLSQRTLTSTRTVLWLAQRICTGGSELVVARTLRNSGTAFRRSLSAPEPSRRRGRRRQDRFRAFPVDAPGLPPAPRISATEGETRNGEGLS
jgi:hypothetical protein